MEKIFKLWRPCPVNTTEVGFLFDICINIRIAILKTCWNFTTIPARFLLVKSLWSKRTWACFVSLSPVRLELLWNYPLQLSAITTWKSSFPLLTVVSESWRNKGSGRPHSCPTISCLAEDDLPHVPLWYANNVL